MYCLTGCFAGDPGSIVDGCKMMGRRPTEASPIFVRILLVYGLLSHKI